MFYNLVFSSIRVFISKSGSQDSGFKNGDTCAEVVSIGTNPTFKVIFTPLCSQSLDKFELI